MKIIVLCGPTATGKTALALSLAKKLELEIVSADSIQIYRGLDIGSAKPTPDEMAMVRHHLIDVADVTDDNFSVSRYKELADEAISDIASRDKSPLIVGGTGLYINSLTFPLSFCHVPPDEMLRKDLSRQEQESPGILYKRLSEIDPERARRLHENDTKRIIRALEIYTISGRKPSSLGDDFANENNAPPPYETIQIGLTVERARLYSRIEARVDDMMREGLLEEVKRFSLLDPELPALKGLGYKQLLSYLRSEVSLDEAVESIKRETRHFAKRQWTWFNRDKRIKWFDSDNPLMLEDVLRYLDRE